MRLNEIAVFLADVPLDYVNALWIQTHRISGCRCFSLLLVVGSIVRID